MAKKKFKMKEKEINKNEINKNRVVDNPELNENVIADIEQKNEQLSDENLKVEENMSAEEQQEKDPLVEMTEKYNLLNDKYIRLTAEYDNYRKRTLKEKMDLMKSAGEDIIVSILPVLDNFERALKAIGNSKDIEAVKEGINLTYTNFKEFLKQRGVIEIEAINQELNTDFHDAITKIPAPDEDAKGKILDVIEKGYMLKDKVIRFAKVVVGE